MRARHRRLQAAARPRPPPGRRDRTQRCCQAGSQPSSRTDRAGVRRRARRAGRLTATRGARRAPRRLARDERVWPTVAGCAASRHRHADRADGPSRARRRLASLRLSRQAGAWLALTPSLQQSGAVLDAGAITKTGSSLARRLLVESAWHYPRRPLSASTLARRQAAPTRFARQALARRRAAHAAHHPDARPRRLPARRPGVLRRLPRPLRQGAAALRAPRLRGDERRARRDPRRRAGRATTARRSSAAFRAHPRPRLGARPLLDRRERRHHALDLRRRCGRPRGRLVYDRTIDSSR